MDAQGGFKIESVDCALLFRVLVVAKGFEPTFFAKVDPEKGPLEAKLKPRSAPNLPAGQIIRGRVQDADGRPIAQAVVSVEGTHIGSTTHGWPPEGTDPLAVTDENGEFDLRSPQRFDWMNLRVEARGFARRDFAEVRPGSERRGLTVTVGAQLTGRVLQAGKPVPNITIGVASVDRTMGNFTGDFVTGTGEDGRFAFLNLPPEREYAVYGLMNSMKGIGALPTKVLRVKGDGSKNDMGTLEVVPGFSLAGQVLLSDTNAIPAHTRLSVGRETAWDSANIELSTDGRFEFTSVPGEILTLSTRIPGYRLAARNASLDRLNPFRLVGQLNADKTNLVMLFEPGKDLSSEHSPEDERPENLPLGGIETKRIIPDAVVITGRVLDAESKTGLPTFKVTPGRRRDPKWTWTEWQPTKSITGTNGTFVIELSGKGGAILFTVEAEGYLPIISEPLFAGQTNCVLRLKKGTGPSGIVRLPDGNPLAGGQVCYIAGHDQINLTAEGRILDSRASPSRHTDKEGRFSFAPKIGEGELVVACTNGFARVALSANEPTNMLTVQAWSRVRGRLVQRGNSVAQERVDIEFDREYRPGHPLLHLHGTVTDNEGRFEIRNVPPASMRLTTRVPDGTSGSWTSQTQKQFTAKPGDDLDLGDIEKR